jgi:hypothetical protein
MANLVLVAPMNPFVRKLTLACPYEYPGLRIAGGHVVSAGTRPAMAGSLTLSRRRALLQLTTFNSLTDSLFVFSHSTVSLSYRIAFELPESLLRQMRAYRRYCASLGLYATSEAIFLQPFYSGRF